MKLSSEQIKDLTNLLDMTWKKRNGQSDPKMVEHCLKSSKYIQIGDMFVDCCDLKPSITTTIWYDDTREGPEANWQNFKNLNERHNMPKKWELDYRHTDPLYFQVHYWDDKTAKRLVCLAYIPEDHQGNAELIRKVTPEELEQINAAIEEVRQDYAKRLETYFKRYGKEHVTSQGYWVDR